MVNISKIAKLGKTAVNRFKNLPTKEKVVVGAFGGVIGIDIGLIALICANSNKEKQNTTLENDNNSIMAKNDSLQNCCDSLQLELKKVNGDKVGRPFEYEPEREYVTSDTTFYGKSKPERISYKDELGREIESVNFEKNGACDYTSTSDYDTGYIIDGKLYKGSAHKLIFSSGTEVQTYYDKKGDELEQWYRNNHLEEEISYDAKTDISKSWIDLEHDGKSIEIYRKNRNGKTIKAKHLKDGVLEYTVVPKYDKDGTVVKNDTIWNKK